MSGHSKWSKVKHQKEASDATKGKVFTKLANAIIIAVKAGGGISDPQSNMRLRLAVEKARGANMPKEKIERAIERGQARDKSDNYEEAIYEGFGPGGVGIIIETATNNKQRAVSELKNILERGGGRLATPGSVTHFFNFVGLIAVSKNGEGEGEIMEKAINAGAMDLADAGNTVDIFTQPGDLHKVKDLLLRSGLNILTSELTYRPTTVVPVSDPATAKQILTLLNNLEDIEDVQKVYANFDIPDELLK